MVKEEVRRGEVMDCIYGLFTLIRLRGKRGVFTM